MGVKATAMPCHSKKETGAYKQNIEQKEGKWEGNKERVPEKTTNRQKKIGSEGNLFGSIYSDWVRSTKKRGMNQFQEQWSLGNPLEANPR